MGRGMEDIQQELKLFPFHLADDLEAGEVLRIQLARRPLRRRRFRPSFCVSLSAMPSASLMRR